MKDFAGLNINPEHYRISLVAKGASFTPPKEIAEAFEFREAIAKNLVKENFKNKLDLEKFYFYESLIKRFFKL